MADDVREKLLKVCPLIVCGFLVLLMDPKRLKSEVAAWYRLQHANICPLFGVMQSVQSIAMVSPWCNNGTIMQYIQRTDIQADQLALVRETMKRKQCIHVM